MRILGLAVACCLMAASAVQRVEAHPHAPLKKSVFEYKKKFPSFLKDLKVKCLAAKGVNAIPGLSWMIAKVSEVNPKESVFLDRFFDNEQLREQAVQKLFIDIQNYQEELKKLVAPLRKPVSLDALKMALHKRNVALFGLPASTTIEQMGEYSNKKDANGNYLLKNDLYFAAVAFVLFSVHIHQQKGFV